MWYWTKVLFLIFLGALVAWLAFEIITFPDIGKLRKENPTTTSLIDFRIREKRAEGKTPRKNLIWRPLSGISANLQKAVLAGEDARFVEHDGFDWDSIEKAWEEARREGEKQAKAEGEYDPDDWIPPMPKFKRGASTITQQLAKNLYLSQERSFLRKGREAAITYVLERELSKRRILELYLNVIEWGDGIYGAVAAARYHLKKSSKRLTPAEAAYLAAMIPSPLNVFNPKKNPRRVRRRQQILQKQMRFVKLRK